MRLLNAVPEFNRQYATTIRTIALTTTPDRHAWFAREADESHDLGPATVVSADGERRLAYLDHDLVMDALDRVGADAVWVGWGFVSEHAEFAQRCEDAGISFIGPPAAVIRRLGDKIASKQLAERAGVRVVPWGGRAAADLDEARAHAEVVGYPLMVKAAAGGGGRGIRNADRQDQLEAAFREASSEAAHAVGDATVFLERRLPAARHIEVQVIADGAGTVWPVGIRDCSVQRRHQKVIEESDSTALWPTQQRRAERRCAAVVQRGGVPQRRHRGVPPSPRGRDVVLHGGQRPAAGRAPRDRDDDRSGSGQAAVARRSWRPARGRSAAGVRPRRRGPAHR